MKPPFVFEFCAVADPENLKVTCGIVKGHQGRHHWANCPVNLRSYSREDEPRKCERRRGHKPPHRETVEW